MDTPQPASGVLEAVEKTGTGRKQQRFEILNYLTLKTCSAAVLSEHHVTEADSRRLPIRPDIGATII